MNTIKTEWNLNPLASGDNDPKFSKKRDKTEKAVSAFVNKWKDRNDYLKDPSTLKKALDEYEELQRDCWMYGDEWYYFVLRSMQEQGNPKIKAKQGQANSFAKKLNNQINFFEIKVAKIGKEERQKFLEHEELKEYRHYLKRLFKSADHLLSSEEEKIMNLKSTTAFENWVQMLSAFLSSEEKEVLVEKDKKEVRNFSELLSLFENKNKKVRDSAASAFNEVLKRHSSTAEWEINSVLENKKVDDEIRGFKRPDQSRFLSDDMDAEVVDTLVDVVSDNFRISKDFYSFKAKLLGLKKLDYHERSLKYGKIDLKYEYEEAVDLIYRVFKILDEEFAQIFKRFIEGGQVDVYPKKGKSDGAFCAYNLISQPVYVLLNYTGNFNDVLTIAHEFGHAINDEIIKKNQNALNFGTPLSTAEVASTFMEDFITQEVLKDASDELRLSIMVDRMDRQVATVFRQIAAMNFERDLHKTYREEGYLSREEVGEVFNKHMKSYMGKAVNHSKDSHNWWVYWSHFRKSFYVYTYASGYLISKYMQRKVKEDAVFIEKVKSFLSAGKSDSPREIFNKLGIDIKKKEFWQDGVKEVEGYFEKVQDLAKRLGKI